jgi:hypothetical protein
MPKKSAAKTPVKAAYSRPNLFPIYIAAPLTLEERSELRKIIISPLFQKVIANAHTRKPSVVPKGTGTLGSEYCEQIATNRLHQLQGWEMFEAALFSQAETSVPAQRSNVQEKYNDETT